KLLHGLYQHGEVVAETDRLFELGREVRKDLPAVHVGSKYLIELNDRLLEAVLQDPVAVLDPHADVVRLTCDRDVEQLRIDDLLKLQGKAVDKGIVKLVEI